jgi:hypothetical protein
MTRTYNLDESDIRRALEEYVRRTQKAEGSLSVRLHHDAGDAPYHRETYTAEVVETTPGPQWEGKD